MSLPVGAGHNRLEALDVECIVGITAIGSTQTTSLVDLVLDATSTTNGQELRAPVCFS